MSAIHLTLQASPDNAADHAYELKQYLQTNWEIQVKAKPVDASSDGAETKALGFDAESLQILIQLGIGARLAIDSAHGLLETRQKLAELADWAEKTFTSDHEYLWLHVGGIPYPVKAENLDDIVKAIQEQE